MPLARGRSGAPAQSGGSRPEQPSSRMRASGPRRRDAADSPGSRHDCPSAPSGSSLRAPVAPVLAAPDTDAHRSARPTAPGRSLGPRAAGRTSTAKPESPRRRAWRRTTWQRHGSACVTALRRGRSVVPSRYETDLWFESASPCQSLSTDHCTARHRLCHQHYWSIDQQCWCRAG